MTQNETALHAEVHRAGDGPALPDSSRQHASVGECLAMGAATVFLHVAILFVVLRAWGIPFEKYAAAGDGPSYVAYARVINDSRLTISAYDSRVFPGYPSLIALAAVIADLPFVFASNATWLAVRDGSCLFAAPCVTIACAALATALTGRLFGARLGWAMLALTPHWIINSSLLMSEAPMLAFALIGLLMGQRRGAMATVGAGLCLGLACIIRPMAAFALLGQICSDVVTRRTRRIVPMLVLVGFVAHVNGLRFANDITGDAFQSFRVYSHSPAAYRDGIFTWPFHALLDAPMKTTVGVGSLVYVGTHVAVVLGGCRLLVQGARRDRSSLALPAAVWLCGNTLFVLCISSGPYGWGFYHFPRFILPALPPLLWAYQRYVPCGTVAKVAFALLGFAIGVIGVHHAIITPPPVAWR